MSAAAWVDCMPEDDVDGFSQRSDERRQVFEDAAARLPTTELSPLVWAFLQVGNLEQVKDLARNNVSWLHVKGNSKLSTCEQDAKDAVLLWKQRPSAPSDTTQVSSKRSYSEAFSNQSPSSPLRTQAGSHTLSTKTRSGKPLEGPEYSPQRDRKIAERCKERDHGLCVVSRIGAVDACHIYPWRAFGGKDSNRVVNFWEILRMFWPSDKVDSWHAKLFRDNRTADAKGTETVENMLTFTSTLHRFHSEGAFALRPVCISDDNTQLVLEFHWLARQERDPSAKVDLLEEPLSSRDRKDSGQGYKFCRHDDANPTLLVSGTRFTMKTDDAMNKPLPDPGLLELQWHLQRILAMSGAAGWKEEDFDYDDGISAEIVAVPSVEQWLDDQSIDGSQSRSHSPNEWVESVDDAHEQ